MSNYPGISKVELDEHHGQLVNHIGGALGGSSARRTKVKTLLRGMLEGDLDTEGFQRTGKVTPDEFKHAVNTLLASKEIHPHEAEEMHRRAANALRD